MYLTGCVPKSSHHLLDKQIIGFLTTPNIGNTRQPEWIWAADSGCFNRKTYKGDANYIDWLKRQHSKNNCLFATAPDVVGNAEATLSFAESWLPLILDLGYYPALVTQDGMTPAMIPWDNLHWLFIGGTDQHKLGHEAIELIHAAHRNGKKIHVGRVNSGKRFAKFAAYNCDTADGTYLGFGPSINVVKLQSWIDKEKSFASLFSLSTSNKDY